LISGERAERASTHQLGNGFFRSSITLISREPFSATILYQQIDEDESTHSLYVTAIMPDAEEYEDIDDAVTTHPTTAEEAQAFTSGSELAGVNVAAEEQEDEAEDDDEDQAEDEDQDQDDDQHDDQLRSRRKEKVADPPSSGLVAEIKNMTATVNLDAAIDLKTVALHARNAEYNPKRFSAVIMRIREPKATALIFSTGKMVVTGCRTENDAKLAGRKFACIIQKLGFQPKFKDFKMQNIVGIVDCGFPIKLDNLANSHDKFSSYEPEIFPGLIYRMMQPRIVCLTLCL